MNRILTRTPVGLKEKYEKYVSTELKGPKLKDQSRLTLVCRPTVVVKLVVPRDLVEVDFLLDFPRKGGTYLALSFL